MILYVSSLHIFQGFTDGVDDWEDQLKGLDVGFGGG